MRLTGVVTHFDWTVICSYLLGLSLRGVDNSCSWHTDLASLRMNLTLAQVEQKHFHNTRKAL